MGTPAHQVRPTVSANDPYGILAKDAVLAVFGFRGVDSVMLAVSDLLEELQLGQTVDAFTDDTRMMAIVNPASWTTTLGFDPRRAREWSRIGIDPEAGIYIAGVVLDARRLVPLVVFKKSRDGHDSRYLEILKAKATPMNPQVPGWQTARLGNRMLWMHAVRDIQLVLILDDDTFALEKTGGVETAGRILNAVIASPGSSMSDLPFIHSSAKAIGPNPGAHMVLNGHALGNFVHSRGGESAIVSHVLTEFRGLVGAVHRGGITILVSLGERTRTALQTIFRSDPADLAKYFPDEGGWSIGRQSIHFAGLFTGIAEFLPPSMTVQRAQVLSVPTLFQSIGLDYGLMSKAFTGHGAFGFDAVADIASKEQRADREPMPEHHLGVLQVADAGAADAFLEALATVFRRQGLPAATRISIASRSGYAVETPSGTVMWVRAGPVVLVSRSASIIESAIAEWSGKNLSQRPEGQYLDQPQYGLAQVFTVRSTHDSSIKPEFKKAIERLTASGGHDAYTDALRGILFDVLEKTKSFTGHLRLHEGVELKVDGGRAGLTMLAGLLAAVAIPAFVKYGRRTQSAEARMNLARLLHATRAYHDSMGTVSQNSRLPQSAESPARDAWYRQVCRDGKPGVFIPDTETWSARTWTQLGFAIEKPFRYQYHFLSQSTGPGAGFTIRAVGDLDCDGVYSTFERIGTVGPDGRLTGGDAAFIDRELE